MKQRNLDKNIKRNLSFNRAIKKIISLLLYPLKHILPKKYIIFSGTTNYNYNGNCRYLFEYLSKNSSHKVYWFTRSDIVKNYLNENGLNQLSYSNPIKLIIVSAMAKIIMNDGDDYLNIFGLSDTKETIKISLFHGFGPKITLYDKTKDIRTERINKFDYVNFTSSYLGSEVSKKIFNLPSKKVKILGFPRNDLFYMKDLAEKSLENKKIINRLCKSAVNESMKVLLYTPTWRPYDYNLPIMDITGFKDKLFNDFLADNNILFIYSTHSANPPKSHLKNSPNITYIDSRYPLYDTNLTMLESDILINDYSTTSVDFSILRRPQIFCMPDYKIYKNTKGFLEDYKNSMPGQEATNFASFCNIVMESIYARESYLKRYENKRITILEKYYNLNNNNSSMNHSKFIDNIMRN